MSFDTSTLYLVAAMVAAMLGAMLLFFGKQENIPALKWWGTAYLLGAASVALWTIGGNALGETFSLALNAVGFVACGMVWNASRVFHGRKPNLPGLVLGALAWIAAVATLGPDASALRMTIGAGIVAIYAALTATELWTERRRTLQKRWPTFAVPVLHGFVLMLPILLGDLLHPQGDLSGSIWVTVFSIELVLYAVGTVFIIFMLVSERTVTAHKTAASMDPLTGMFNRRGFAEACARVIEREANAGRPVTVMIFDIDHFKSINDRFGHPAGDEILKLFSAVVVSGLRISDLSGRIGGEEFAALLPCSLEEGVVAAERLREAFEASGIVDEVAGPVDTTVSIGVAGGPAGTELEVLLAAADTALYQAKRGGRNRVEAAEELPLSLENWRRKTAGGQPHQKPAVRLA
jgi:diguanylate cyclase (GGDEF)-like protein